tara:strand:+ start:365 stop:559 length:195 start_codon:yes stop_codon:yes gene_type:complete
MKKTVPEIRNRNMIRHRIETLSTTLKQLSEESISVKIDIKNTKTGKVVKIRFDSTQASVESLPE